MHLLTILQNITVCLVTKRVLTLFDPLPPPQVRFCSTARREHEAFRFPDRGTFRVPGLRPSGGDEGPHRVLLRMKTKQAPRGQEIPQESRARRKLRGYRSEFRRWTQRESCQAGRKLFLMHATISRVRRHRYPLRGARWCDLQRTRPPLYPMPRGCPHDNNGCSFPRSLPWLLCFPCFAIPGRIQGRQTAGVDPFRQGLRGGDGEHQPRQVYHR